MQQQIAARDEREKAMQQQITRLTDGLSHVPELADAVNAEMEEQRNVIASLAGAVEAMQCKT